MGRLPGVVTWGQFGVQVRQSVAWTLLSILLTHCAPLTATAAAAAAVTLSYKKGTLRELMNQISCFFLPPSERKCLKKVPETVALRRREVTKEKLSVLFLSSAS